MRSILVATLALSPILLHAQAAKPAQPNSGTVLQANLTSPAVLTDTAATTSAPLRVSTGIAGPRLIHSVTIGEERDWPLRIIGADKTVVLTLLVDATGKPTNLHVLQSAGLLIDSEVLQAVNQYRYQPATLDGQPTAVPVNLSVVLQPGAKY